MKTLIILLLSLSVFAEDDNNTDVGLFAKKKADFLEKMKANDNPERQDIECVEKAETRNSMNQCAKAMMGRKRENRKNPEKEQIDLDE